MLNRLFIIVGLIAILALAAAFVVPNFIQWGDYRERLQAMASETLGAPVEITGDDETPLATLRLTVEVVGSDDHDQTGIARVSADVPGRPGARPPVPSRPEVTGGGSGSTA